MQHPVKIGNVNFGDGSLGWICGPCMLESLDMVKRVAAEIVKTADASKQKFVFKGSFDKANRTSADSPRGPGLDAGLKMLATVKREFGLPVITDIHESQQAQPAAEVCDALQIPAFLCRQTSLIEAAANTGKPLMIKRGQFMAPGDMALAAAKAKASGGVLLAERGSSFGYNDLVVDFRALPVMRAAAPVVFDATHSVQKPGAAAGQSGGAREFLLPLARAAIAVGVDGVFLETHPDPTKALSDKQTQLPLADFAATVVELANVHHRIYAR